MADGILTQVKLPNNKLYDVRDLKSVSNGIGATAERSAQLNEDSTRSTINTFTLTNPQTLYNGLSFNSGAGNDPYPQIYTPTEVTLDGKYSTIMGEASFACGRNAVAYGHNCIAHGDCSTAGGESCVAAGGNSRAFGRYTLASGFNSLAEGWNTVASGQNSRADGKDNVASGVSSFATGTNNTASGDRTFVTGSNCTAAANNSLAVGYYASTPSTVTGGIALGNHVSTAYTHQVVLGEYNTQVKNSAGNDVNSALIVGGGTSDTAQRNLLAVIKDTGSLKTNGTVYVNCNDNSSGGYEVIST